MNSPRFFKRHNVFYGWIVVFVCFVVISLVFGVRLSFGLFFDALTRPGAGGETFGWSRGDTAGIFSISMVVFAATGTIFGWLLDRWGPRRLFALGLLFMISGLALTSRMSSLWQFALYYGVWTSLGITALGLSIQAATVSRWFDRMGRRGLAIGLAFAGSGAGILVMAPLVERIISLFGWRQAYLVLALLLVLVPLPLVLLFLRNSPQEIGLRPDGQPEPLPPLRVDPATERSTASLPTGWTFRAAVGTGAFWLLMLAGACSLFTLRMVSVHQVAYLVDRGVPRLTAATVLGAAGLITALAFVAFGAMSDRIGRGNAFYLSSVAQVVALVVLLTLPPAGILASSAMLYVYALFWGIGEGGRSGLLTAMASDAFPGPAQGTIVGTMGAFFGLGAAGGSWVGGAVYDWSGQYALAFQVALVATGLATAAVAGVGFITRRLSIRNKASGAVPTRTIESSNL